MTAQPQYARRLARVARVLELLALHPDGLRVSQLAKEVGASEAELREELLAFYTADVSPDDLHGLLRADVIAFVGADGDDEDPQRAEIVRVKGDQLAGELGVDYLTAGELSQVYLAGRRLLQVEPDNVELAAALETLEVTTLQGVQARPSDWQAEVADRLRTAVREPRLVRVTYARAWRPGVRERMLQPYALHSTRRGWELDAGTPEEPSTVRTYLATGMQEVDVLDNAFAPPADVDAAVAANRATYPVDLVLPHASKWVVDRFAESVTVLSEDEESVKVRAFLLGPVEQRLGLMLVIAGPEAFVVSPDSLVDAGVALARELLEHHG